MREPLHNSVRGDWRHDYALGWVLLALFLSSWIAQALLQGPYEGWREFWISTTENWQSEFLQLLTFVVLTAKLIFKGSHESKDSSDDETRARLERIEQRLGQLG